jgi:hypothetical protein
LKRTRAKGRAGLTIVQAMRRRDLFGGLAPFRDLGSWRAWLTFLRAVYGLPLNAEDLALFQRHTGRQEPRTGGYPEAVAIVGRQSGKSRIAATVAAFEAVRARGERDGTDLYALLVAQDERASLRTLFAYAAAPFEKVPGLAAAVRSRKAGTLTLDSHATLAAYPCRPAAVRGLRARVVVCDELAFYISGEGNPTDREMLRAVRPCVATTRGRVIVLSSPYGQSGALWDLHRQHYGREDSSTLLWQASAPDMNPTLPPDYLARMEADDPEAYRSEVLGEFRAGLSTLFDPDAIGACVVAGRRELAPVADVGYRAFADPSGGRADSFAVAVGHRAGERVVVDVVRAWKPPFNPSGVVAEAAGLLKTYRVSEVTGDRFGGEWPREAFRAQGVEYRVAERTTSENLLSLLPVVNTGVVELLEVPDLLRELRGLERRRGTSGRDRVEGRRGSHDDLAAALAGLVSLLPVESAGWDGSGEWGVGYRGNPWSTDGSARDADGDRADGYEGAIPFDSGRATWPKGWRIS